MKVFKPRWVKKAGSYVVITHKEQGKDKSAIQDLYWFAKLSEAMNKYNELCDATQS